MLPQIYRLWGRGGRTAEIRARRRPRLETLEARVLMYGANALSFPDTVTSAPAIAAVSVERPADILPATAVPVHAHASTRQTDGESAVVTLRLTRRHDPASAETTVRGSELRAPTQTGETHASASARAGTWNGLAIGSVLTDTYVAVQEPAVRVDAEQGRILVPERLVTTQQVVNVAIDNAIGAAGSATDVSTDASNGPRDHVVSPGQVAAIPLRRRSPVAPPGVTNAPGALADSQRPTGAAGSSSSDGSATDSPRNKIIGSPVRDEPVARPRDAGDALRTRIPNALGLPITSVLSSADDGADTHDTTTLPAEPPSYPKPPIVVPNRRAPIASGFRDGSADGAAATNPVSGTVNTARTPLRGARTLLISAPHSSPGQTAISAARWQDLVDAALEASNTSSLE